MRRWIGGSLVLLVSLGAASFGAEGTVLYHPFSENKPEELHVWEGRRLVLLTKRDDYPPDKMRALMTDLDRVYEYYAKVTGREPVPLYTHKGKPTIAEVPATGNDSLALGVLGRTGIEISTPTMEEAIAAHTERREMHVVFPWEFGRNFWFGQARGESGSNHDGLLADMFTMAMQSIATRELRLNPERTLALSNQRLADVAAGVPSSGATVVLGGREDVRIAAALDHLHRTQGGDGAVRSVLPGLWQEAGIETPRQLVTGFNKIAQGSGDRPIFPEEPAQISARVTYYPAPSQTLTPAGISAWGGGDLSR